ncbi:glycosyltransferase family 4 protein [Pedobacter gandavensis]|uniref:glycosyltransferase family 4 protein n=1 Tax=Pedobacter gandavensis TaxID=2679963 RepID=UPI002930A5DA|nr:glycosyltransferase family 4 protein [Pedobacter gandavensis]
MKILIVNCVYDPEPVVSAQIGKALAEELSNNGHDVEVLAPFPSRPAGFKFNADFVKDKINTQQLSKTLKVSRLPSFICPKSNVLGRLWESISFGWHTYRYILDHANEIDRVYMNTWPLFGQYGVAKACKKRNIPYAVHIQDLYPESLTNKLPGVIGKLAYPLLFKFEKYTLKNASKIIAISRKMKNFIASSRAVDADKIEVVLNWQEQKDFIPYGDTWPSTKRTFMYLGNIGPVAGLPLVLNAFIKANVNAQLVLAGSGSKLEECKEIAEKNPGFDIVFREVPGGQVPKVQSEAHVLLLPMIKGAASSSIPSKLPAYMFSERPIIVLADKGSDTANAVIEAQCGWVGEAEDVDWLANTIQEVALEQDASLKKLGLNGRDYCLRNFSKEVNLTKLVWSIVNE